MHRCEGVVNWIAYIANNRSVKSSDEASHVKWDLRMRKREDFSQVISGCLKWALLLHCWVDERKNQVSFTLLPSTGRWWKCHHHCWWGGCYVTLETHRQTDRQADLIEYIYIREQNRTRTSQFRQVGGYNSLRISVKAPQLLEQKQKMIIIIKPNRNYKEKKLLWIFVFKNNNHAMMLVPS